MMRIQIQLLSNTLHRQLFMVYLQNMKWEGTLFAPVQYHYMSKDGERAKEREIFVRGDELLFAGSARCQRSGMCTLCEQHHAMGC